MSAGISDPPSVTPRDLMRAERNKAINQKLEAQRRYDDLLQNIARAVVKELKVARYIEIHENNPRGS
jgi:hypothetical protein